MKTNNVMARSMGEFSVQQRTDNKMFNATNLLEQWNNLNPDNQRRLDKFWESTHLPELMEEIVKNEYSTSVIITHVNSESTYPKIGDVNEDSNTRKIRELKKILCKTSKARSDRGGGTWMHPLLFIKFAMYLNPRFEYQVLKFVQDELIEVRHEAGDNYCRLSNSISKLNKGLTNPNFFGKVASALNYIVFNKHDNGLRQTATLSELKELSELETFISNSIECGFIKTADQLTEALRIKWRNKYMPI